jgi:hypothetical protein
MNLKKAIEILCKDLEEKEIVIEYQNELMFDISIKRCPSFYYMIVNVPNYSIATCPEKYSIYDKKEFVFEEEFETSEKLFTTLYNFFKKDGTIRYSRITDKIYENDEELIKEEEIEMAKNFLCSRKDTECCLCDTLSNIFTICGHNLCRYCYKNLFVFNCRKECYVKCPVCNIFLKDRHEEN